MTGKRSRSSCDDDVNLDIERELHHDGSEDSQTKQKKEKRLKEAKDSPSPTSTLYKGESPPTVDSKYSSRRSLSFSNDEKGEPESSIVKKRLKYLCRIEEPTVNVGIEMVGAAYLLKLMASKSGDDDQDDKKIERAMKQVVKAAKLLFHADHCRNNALQRLSSKSQKLFDKFL